VTARLTPRQADFVVPLRAAAVAGTGGKALRAEATLGGPQDVE
jgi:hypothetical protein